jgi:hypothetical protein
MSFGLLFWVLVILWAIFGFFYYYRPTVFGGYAYAGNSVLLIVLFSLLGWAVFGPPLHG